MNDTQFLTPQSVASSMTQEVVGASPAPKKSFMDTLRGIPIKPMIIGFLVVCVLVIIGFFAYRLFQNRTVVNPVVNVKLWGFWEDSSALREIISEYERKHPNTKIQYEKQSLQDYRERLTSALAREGGPDIFRFHNTWVPMLKNELVPVPKEIIDIDAFQKVFYPVAFKDLHYKGQIVGIPLMLDGLGLYINEDMFAQSGLAAPTTWDDLRQRAIELTTYDEAKQITRAGVALGTTSNVDHWQDILALMMIQNGVDLKNPIGSLAEDALLVYTEFVTAHHVWDGTLPSSTLAFANNKVAMYFAPSWRAFEIRQQNPALRFSVVPVPQLAKSSSEPDITWASYWVGGVSTKSKVKQQAFEFLKFLNEPAQSEKLYADSARTYLIGEPYARSDMQHLILDDPIAGVFAKQAPWATSWYLTSFTQDGSTGINTRISKPFEDAVNEVLQGGSATTVLEKVKQGVVGVLAEYEL